MLYPLLYFQCPIRIKETAIHGIQTKNQDSRRARPSNYLGATSSTMGDSKDVPLWEVVKQAYKRLETLKEAYGSLCSLYRNESSLYMRELLTGASPSSSPPEEIPAKKKGLFGMWGGGGGENGGTSPRNNNNNGDNGDNTSMTEASLLLHRKRRMGALKRMVRVLEGVEAKVAPVFTEFNDNLDNLILFELPDDTIKQYITSRPLLEIYSRQKRAKKGAK